MTMTLVTNNSPYQTEYRNYGRKVKRVLPIWKNLSKSMTKQLIMRLTTWFQESPS